VYKKWLLVIGAFRSSLCWPDEVPSEVRCGTDWLLCCLIVGIHTSGISIQSSLLTDVVMVKSYVNGLSNPMGAPVWVTVNTWMVSGLTSMFWDRWGLSSCEPNISPCSCIDLPVSLMSLCSLLHLVLFCWVNSILRLHCDLSVVSDLKTVHMPCCCKQQWRASDMPLIYGRAMVDFISDVLVLF